MEENFMDGGAYLWLPFCSSLTPESAVGGMATQPKNGEGEGFQLPVQERPNCAKVDVRTRERPAWPPHLQPAHKWRFV